MYVHAQVYMHSRSEHRQRGVCVGRGGEQREHECTMRLQCSRQISVITKSEEAAASGRGEFTQEITWQSAFRTDLKCCCIKGPWAVAWWIILALWLHHLPPIYCWTHSVPHFLFDEEGRKRLLVMLGILSANASHRDNQTTQFCYCSIILFLSNTSQGLKIVKEVFCTVKSIILNPILHVFLPFPKPSSLINNNNRINPPPHTLVCH